ncbi:hypothetical protein SLEP1_g1393 [Rubroshorea leprosula]|uniref:Uncharacterized protein n=1 Tax=Rubroshorea leprosula TaxID=152421 RepID=A0AAV5HJJ3_9ROSI|nr:hypothetical protein SLEP1_g1393 [Rubroshorea leprosula]
MPPVDHFFLAMVSANGNPEVLSREQFDDPVLCFHCWQAIFEVAVIHEMSTRVNPTKKEHYNIDPTDWKIIAKSDGHE